MSAAPSLEAVGAWSPAMGAGAMAAWNARARAMLAALDAEYGPLPGRVPGESGAHLREWDDPRPPALPPPAPLITGGAFFPGGSRGHRYRPRAGVALDGADLARRRTAVGVTQRGLAAEAGVSRGIVGTLESGGRDTCSQETAARLAAALDRLGLDRKRREKEQVA